MVCGPIPHIRAIHIFKATKQLKVKKIILKISGIFTLLCALILPGCNAKEEETPDESYVSAESVAITAFSLTADIRVMANLDSVYFSIDLEHGVVFNADSLPKGTNITKLVPKISYPSSVTAAVIEMKGGTHREDGTVNYYANKMDTIDFTGDVTLTLSAGDNISKTYSLKVNVHQEDPDTLFWEHTAMTPFPSRMQNPRMQKTVAFNGGSYSLIEEADGSFTAATSSDLFAASWSKSELTLPFIPDIRTLSSSADGKLYLLGSGGELMESADGSSWTQQDSGWSQIIGAYGDAMLGVKSNGNIRNMVCFPAGYVDEVELPSDFPASGYSAPVEYSTRWAALPTIVIFGNGGSWAFDGTAWADIADQPLPALDGLAVTPYYSFLNNSSNGLLKEFNALLAFGGRLPDGTVNNTVYISYNQGINWAKAPAYMQLPEDISTGYLLDAVAAATQMQGNLSDRWNARRRVNYEIDGDFIKWECPYIFLFGGLDTSGEMNPYIRTGVLRRLTFAPLF